MISNEDLIHSLIDIAEEYLIYRQDESVRQTEERTEAISVIQDTINTAKVRCVRGDFGE